MKKIFVFFIALTSFFACQDSKVVDSDNGDYFFKDEEDCACNPDLLNKPDSALVTIRVTINTENPETNIEIHEGDFNGKLIKTISTIESRISDSLPLDKKYTYVAKYKKGNDSIVVPVYAKLYASGNECNGFYCYEIINNVIDLSLKF